MPTMSDDLLESHNILRQLVADLKRQRDAALAVSASTMTELNRVQVQRDELRFKLDTARSWAEMRIAGVKPGDGTGEFYVKHALEAVLRILDGAKP